MYNQPETVMEQYDLEIKQITKGRGAYICDTDRGKKILTPFRGSEERAGFLRETLIYLETNGFPVEQVSLSKEGKAVAEDDMGTRWWVKDYMAGTECSTGRESDMEQAAHKLAELHVVLRKCTLEIPDFMKNERNHPQSLFERHYRELVKVKNYVNSRKSRNLFERMYMEQYPHYMEHAKAAISLLERLDIGGEDVLCHGDFNHHNVLHTPAGIRITNFEAMNCNYQVMDLSNFIRKMMEKNQWDMELGKHLFLTYHEICPLTKEERTLLYLTLLFPEKFWKISNHYNNSHKAWVSERDIEKLERMIKAEPLRISFLENFLSFL